MQKNILIAILILAALLRFWNLDKVPVSLFGDEVDVGYQAYSILKTGKDYSGNILPIHFRSLAEWRTPLYIYSSIPTVALFGISAWGVRLPAAIFGIIGVFGMYLLVSEMTKNKRLGLLAAFLLCISPWHLQYSRAGFEVTEMLSFIILGMYFFLLSLRGKNTLWLAVLLLGLAPWVYNTAKLFLPLMAIALLVVWKNELRKISKKRWSIAIIIGLIVTIPFAFSTFLGGGAQRIGDISIFNNPTIIPQMGFDRLNDIQVREEKGSFEQSVNLQDKLFHNQILSFGTIFLNNYFQAFSTDFLFISGDALNLRQSSGIQLYRIDLIFLICGLIFLLTSNLDKKIKIFLLFYLVASPIPASLTQGGGSHATRLILMLPILITLITFGIYFCYRRITRKYRVIFLFSFFSILSLNFIFYQHNYWMHYPWRSERWWQAGIKEAMSEVVNLSKEYKKIIISNADEPMKIFFLGYTQYSPALYQEWLKNPRQEVDTNFGVLEKIDNFYFTPIGSATDLYQLFPKLSSEIVYIATAKEIKPNLKEEPERLPEGLKLLKIISLPSGEPIYYIFTKS